MKTKLSTILALATVAIAGLTTGSGAFAQATFTPGTGSLANCNPNANNSSINTFDAVQCSSSGLTVDMTAWGYTGAANSSGSGFVKGRIGDFDSSGFGAYTGTNESGTGGNHAFDNITSGCGSGSGANSGSNPLSTVNGGCGGSIEGLLLNFGSSKVAVSTVGIGWKGADADMLMFAWTGGGTGPDMTNQAVLPGTSSTSSGGTVSGTLTGWTLVGGADIAAFGNPLTFPTTIYSSYFLITTYFGVTNGNLDMGNDAFKINSFTAQTCSGTVVNNACTAASNGVPEPTSLALVSLALLGGAAVRCRKLRA